MPKRKTGAKMRIIRKMLNRPEGCTAKEVKEAVGWASVSIPQRAKQLKIKLRREKRYWAL